MGSLAVVGGNEPGAVLPQAGDCPGLKPAKGVLRAGLIGGRVWGLSHFVGMPGMG